MSTPYILFGNDTLENQPKAHKGDVVSCKRCGGKHPLEGGTADGEESDLILFYKCGETLYLGAVAGRCIVDIPADVSGSI